MENLANNLITAAKKDRRVLNGIKKTLVSCNEYDLAADIRELEKETFPETEDVKQAKDLAKQLNLVFRMVDLNIEEEFCYLISETLKVQSEKKGDFSIEDAAKLKSKAIEIFG